MNKENNTPLFIDMFLLITISLLAGFSFFTISNLRGIGLTFSVLSACFFSSSFSLYLILIYLRSYRQKGGQS